MNARKIVERPHRVNLSNLNAKPLRFLMADKSVSLSQSCGKRDKRGEERGKRAERRRGREIFFVASTTNRKEEKKRGIVREGEREREERREDSELISLLAVASLNCPRPPSFSLSTSFSLPTSTPFFSTTPEPEVEQFIQARILLVTRHESALLALVPHW